MYESDKHSQYAQPWRFIKTVGHAIPPSLHRSMLQIPRRVVTVFLLAGRYDKNVLSFNRDVGGKSSTNRDWLPRVRAAPKTRNNSVLH